MKRSELKRRTPLQRTAPLGRTGFGIRGNRQNGLRRGKGFEASRVQRMKVRNLNCVVCGSEEVDPAHLIDRSLTSDRLDDSLAVVALCRTHHREYDEGLLSILEYLEPTYRAEVAFAVERVGLVMALQRITNSRVSMEGWA